MNDDLQPIIIGVGQEVWREQDSKRTPVDALQAVAAKAVSDTGSEQVLGAIDTIVHVPFLMNQVPGFVDAMPTNPGAALAERLGINARQYTSDVGGNLPQQLVNEFAARLTRKEGSVVLLCGVELLATFLGAVRAGQPFPDWATGQEDTAIQVGETPVMTAATEQAHGLYEPINAYPLFESAQAHAKGLSAEEHQQLLGSLLSAMSQVAAQNPYAWKSKPLTAAEVLSTAGGNRMISYPYTKVMNAVLAVDQAAAVVLTTVGKAKELGIDPDRWVYLRGAAGAHDSWFLSQRPSLSESPALVAACNAAMEQSGLRVEELTHLELYSCFPSAVQAGCDALGLGVDDPRGVTLTGGLSLFGGPGNNYSLHGIAEMVDRLRVTPEGAGLVWANGGYLTKHAVGVYAREPGISPWKPGNDGELQEAVDALPLVELADVGEGSFVIEAHTVSYAKDNPQRAIALGKLEDGRRCAAVSEDKELLRTLTTENCVGHKGTVAHSAGVNTFAL
ncbi:acetyl-CoA acetyltransferase [Congregibacter brevis]|uniref:Acetyl-CoA acetyltransferase n=1 Tax=Congregibacter brevis TaxID=3081201 RepID=A0ABZ0I817_9GAMM|nr:acetyl-CoA acetyltransferase [Congregibacter sp. IMCC45268]